MRPTICSKGERPLTAEAVEKALCDAEIVIADEEPDPLAPGEEHQVRSPFSTGSPEAPGKREESQMKTLEARGPAGEDTGAQNTPGGRADAQALPGTNHGEAKERALEHIRDLYAFMKGAGASRGGKGVQELQGEKRVEERRRQVRARRTLSPSLRRKVLERDGHRCMAPGCGREHFLVVHHLNPVALGGKDDPHELVTLCPGCHDLVHQHLLRVERDDAGGLRWSPLPGRAAAEACSRS